MVVAAVDYGQRVLNATMEECAAVCTGFTCEQYTRESCALVQNEYGCDCPGCHCDADLVYRRRLRANYTNYTLIYYDDDEEAYEELYMVLALMIFGTLVAIGLTYVAMLTYRNYKYPELAARKKAEGKRKVMEIEIIEFEYMEKEEAGEEETKRIEY